MNHPFRKYDMVIFDVDGTLVDTSKGIVESTNDAFISLGYDPLPEIVIKKCIGPPLTDSLISMNLLKMNDKDIFLKKFRDCYKDRMISGSTLYDGITDVLRINTEKGIINAVATNKPDYLTEKLLRELKVDSYFKVLIGSNPDKFTKKEDMIAECMTITGIPSDKVLYVGDTLHDSVAAAKNSIDFIGVSYGFGFNDGDDAIESPDELLRFIYDKNME